jgi:ATP-dependent helicase YprA (DUF1998 family)
VSKTYTLSQFAEHGELNDADTAAFLNKKFKAGDFFDFAGVSSTTTEFISALFSGIKESDLSEAVQNLDPNVSLVLDHWLAGTTAPTAPAQKPKKAQVKQPPVAPQVPNVTFVRKEPEGERYTPSRLAKRLSSQLQSYIESAYPLSDSTLVMSRKKLLEEGEAGRLLAQEPFVETTPKYRTSKHGYSELALKPETGKFLEKLTQTKMEHDPRRTLLYPDLYEHQAKAFEGALGKRSDLVVATGTGSGKTECFMVPMLGRLHEEARLHPKQFRQRAVRALVLYPMNALVNDQLARLRLLLGSEAVAAEFRKLHDGARHPVFGMYTGRTPYPGGRDRDRDVGRVEPMLRAYLALQEPANQELYRELTKMGRYPAKDLQKFLGEDKIEQTTFKSGKKKGSVTYKHNWSERLRTDPLDRELLTRQEMVRDSESGEGDAPDVLVTNYSMLEYMLMRPFERPIFEQTRAWLKEPDAQLLLVLDEAHMYRGAKGAEVAFLIRRLLARLEITNQPEKLSVICTSASLGDERSAKEVAQRFAADLTGKPPASFEIIFGEREKPTPVAPGDLALAQTLAAISSEALHEQSSSDGILKELQPLFALLKASAPTSVAELPGALYEALRGRPWLNKLLEQTAGHAVALEALSKELFPGSPVARKATETLLALGTLAKSKADEASLIPTRIHLMFRGLSGIYACVNTRCSGRQDSPGGEAPVGKLFSTPKAQCDACGSRVYEVASCRSCGVSYLLGYLPTGQALSFNSPEPEFIWGEHEGDLTQLQMLTVQPRTPERTHEAFLQLKTGLLVPPGQPPETVRKLWFAKDPDSGMGASTFQERCPACQPAGSRRKTRIVDLRTRGEQSFSALIEAQFAEQPPQSNRPELPNRGRKVLVFSDGRQKAARLAPALETSHTSDTFRQVLLLAAQELTKRELQPSLKDLYAGVLLICQQRGVHLFPTDTTFKGHLENARDMAFPVLKDMCSPPLSFAQLLYEEVTDRYYSLQAMGLASIQEHPALAYIFNDFPNVGFTPQEVQNLVRGWIRIQLEHRAFKPIGASRGELGDMGERPEGLAPNKPTDLVPAAFEAFLNKFVGAGAIQLIRDWFRQLGAKNQLLMTEDNFYYLHPTVLVLRPAIDAPWWRCTKCSRLELHAVHNKCFECFGDLVPAAQDLAYLNSRYGYYREQVFRAISGKALEPFGMTTEEHSAQLGASSVGPSAGAGASEGGNYTRVEEYELRFQDIQIKGQAPIDVMSCTTTMEVGIDIGALTGVALRNIPPQVSNYQQRAGRAGRRGKTIASVVTFAHGGSHDAWYYDHPQEIISGQVLSPEVYTENLTVLRRHVSAYLVQRFFHETIAANPSQKSLFESLGLVKQFLDPAEVCSLSRLEKWLLSKRAALEKELMSWLPSICHSSQNPIKLQDLVPHAIDGLLTQLKKELPIEQAKSAAELSPREKEALNMQLEENLLEWLIQRAVFPRYAFPLDTVAFWVPRQRKLGVNSFVREYDYEPSRDLQIALSEYAPGRTLTIDKIRFEGAALYSPYQASIRDTLDASRPYTSCKKCGFVSLKPGDATLGLCPVCAETLDTQEYIRPPGFAPDINAKREYDRGGALTYAGMSTPAKLEVQHVGKWDEILYDERIRLVANQFELVVVNKGIGDRGFMVCPECGAAEPKFGPGFVTPRLFDKTGKTRVHDHPTEAGVKCQTSATGAYFLGHKFLTDVLLMRFKFDKPLDCGVADRPGLGSNPGHSGAPARMALSSLVEALCLAASRELQIDEGELAGNWTPVTNAPDTEADVYLYDLLPGGAGYTHQVRQNLGKILVRAQQLVADCTCESSCHRCLRHYKNQHLHRSLNRHLALALLNYLLTGETPAVTEQQVATALVPLQVLLELKSRRTTPATPSEPMKVELGGVDTWVLVHHPLVDPEEVNVEVARRAAKRSAPIIFIDWYELLYNLPAAFARLQAHST